MIDLLELYGQRFVDLIKSKVPVVSGKTRDSVNYEVIQTPEMIKLVVKGRPFFQSVERGRGLYKQGGYSGFDERLEEWMQDKGFQSKVSKTGVKYYLIGDKWMSGKSLAYLINKRGDKKYREGWKDVYMNDVERLLEELKKDIKYFVKEDLVKTFK